MLAAAAHLQRVTEFLEAFTTGEAEHEVPPTHSSLRAHSSLARFQISIGQSIGLAAATSAPGLG